ncbi:hypothetical protein AB0B88_15990 [Micromonospora haikouensis]|uniref:hypothetical protein n=1 Tax=Micromonospora haikouensis TaxID=686309 RepID=UPI0033D72626
MTDQTTAAPVTLPDWWCPERRTATTRPDGTTEYTFWKFSQYSHKPHIPDNIVRVYRDAIQQGHPDAAERWKRISDEAYAAREAWAHDRHRHDVVDSLRQIADLWPKYAAAKQAADDAYTALERTPDGFWRAALLTLTTARKTARDLAKAVDVHGRTIANGPDSEYSGVCDLPDWQHYAKTEKIDVAGWRPHDPEEYGDNWNTYHPTCSDLDREIERQDELIVDAARLAGDSTPDGR